MAPRPDFPPGSVVLHAAGLCGSVACFPAARAAWSSCRFTNSSAAHVRTFETIEELRLALIEFAQWYSTQWLVARHGYMTPAQVRAEQQQPGALAA